MKNLIFTVLTIFLCFGSEAQTSSCKVVNSDFHDGEYSGSCRNGLASGFGLIKSKGNQYEGNFIDGKMQGKGRRLWPDGTVYDGDFFNDKPHGLGKITYPNGNSYEGDVKNGEDSGNAKIVFSSGTVYVGEVLRGKRNGFGILKLPKNSNYVKSLKNLDSDRPESMGAFIDEFYVLKGLFVANGEDSNFVMACSSKPDCQAKKVAKEKREQLEAREREREDAKRRAYENSPQGRSERQARQLCEAQKATCLASCPYDKILTTQLDSRCENRCNSVSCN